jgi:hypothetical protein
VDFQLTSEQQHLQNKCRELASDFATRTAAHDREASHSVENPCRPSAPRTLPYAGGRIRLGRNLGTLQQRHDVEAGYDRAEMIQPTRISTDLRGSPGTESSQTPRWREMDSNCEFRATSAQRVP